MTSCRRTLASDLSIGEFRLTVSPEVVDRLQIIEKSRVFAEEVNLCMSDAHRA
jgi:hypothetical protein